MKNKTSESLENLLPVGSEITGATIGATIGALGGPIGSIAGSALGIVITKGINEIAQRMLSDREHIRVGESSSYIVSGVKQKIEAGFIVRNDSFFDQSTISRSKADEIIEGVLLKCKSAYEEKKVPYISKIFENVAFSRVNPELANQVINVSERLSFRQLCLLGITINNDNNVFNLNSINLRACWEIAKSW